MSGPGPEPARDLEYIRAVLERTQQRIDPHAFHYVHWGLIVLAWYPADNLCELLGRPAWQLGLGIGAVILGTLLSIVREMRLSRGPRLAGENTFVGRQVGLIVAACIGTGVLLSGFGPATGFIEGPEVPIIWGLVYANLAFMTGVVYAREFLVSGAAILAGTLVAMVFELYNGFILGPVMGLGMMIPGCMAERRVRRMTAEPSADAAGAV